MAFDPATGDLLVGFGDSFANGLMGTSNPQAGVYRVDTTTGAKTTLVTGMQMANGVAIGPSGEIFGSNRYRGRHRQGGAGSPARFSSTGRGHSFERPGRRYRWSASTCARPQTFQPPEISKVRIADAHVTSFFQGAPADTPPASTA